MGASSFQLKTPMEILSISDFTNQSILAKQSSVFKDIFSVPPPSEMDMYDGLPLVHVNGEAKEMKQFIQVIYDTK